MRQKTVIESIAIALCAYINCRDGDILNEEFENKHLETVCNLVAEHLPSGSGFDAGTTIDDVNSETDRIIFDTSFHHRDLWGGYDGWTEHRVIIRPSFIGGFTIRVTGRNRNDIKEYISDLFSEALSRVIVTTN